MINATTNNDKTNEIAIPPNSVCTMTFYPSAFSMASNSIRAGNGLCKNATPPAASACFRINSSSRPVQLDIDHETSASMRR